MSLGEEASPDDDYHEAVADYYDAVAEATSAADVGLNTLLHVAEGIRSGVDDFAEKILSVIQEDRGKFEMELDEPQGKSLSRFVGRKSLAYHVKSDARGKPCKRGQSAKRTGCIPKSKQPRSNKPSKDSRQKPSQQKPQSAYQERKERKYQEAVESVNQILSGNANESTQTVLADSLASLTKDQLKKINDSFSLDVSDAKKQEFKAALVVELARLVNPSEPDYKGISELFRDVKEPSPFDEAESGPSPFDEQEPEPSPFDEEFDTGEDYSDRTFEELVYEIAAGRESNPQQSEPQKSGWMEWIGGLFGGKQPKQAENPQSPKQEKPTEKKPAKLERKGKLTEESAVSELKEILRDVGRNEKPSLDVVIQAGEIMSAFLNQSVAKERKQLAKIKKEYEKEGKGKWTDFDDEGFRTLKRNDKKIKKLKEEFRQLNQDINSKTLANYKELMSAYRKMGREGLGPDIGNVVPVGGSDDAGLKMFEEAYQYYPSDWLLGVGGKKMKIRSKVTEQEREEILNKLGVSGIDRGLASINYADTNGVYSEYPEIVAGDVDSMRHEMGHIFEKRFPRIAELEKEFFEKKTSGKKSTYIGTNKFYMDAFPDFYMGLDYMSGDSFEIMTKGMDLLFNPTDKSLDDDPETKHFVLGLLAAVK